MSHDPHEGEYIVLADSCDECVARANSGLDGLAHLDNGNLRRLAELASRRDPRSSRPVPGASYSDMKALYTLRLAGRIVERSGIDFVLCR